jgi:hypothetical protein
VRWYHWILAYMIILGGLALGAIGDQLGGWFVLGCVASIAGGVLGMKYLPRDDEAI